MDLFMDYHRIHPNSNQLYVVVMVCLTLGSKIEDAEVKIPRISEINKFLDTAIFAEEYMDLERMVLQFFGWNIIMPTAVSFFEFYIEAIVDEFDFVQIVHTGRFAHFDAMKLAVIERAVEFLDATLNESHLLQILPSIVAASCLAAARESLNIGQMWSASLQRLTRYTAIEIRQCVDTLLRYRSQAINNLSVSSNMTRDSGYLTDIDERHNVT